MKPIINPSLSVDRLKKGVEVRRLLYRLADIPMDKYTRTSNIFRARSIWDLMGNSDMSANIPDKHDAKQGGYMDRIKFKDWEKVTQKGYAMMQINGTYVGGDKDGEPFSTRFFASAKHLAGPVKDASAGDILAITFKQNGKYRNAIKIENETANGTAPMESAGNPGSVGGGSLLGTGVQLQSPTDTKTLDAKLATRFYLDARMAKIKPEDISEAFVEALQLADMVQDWRAGQGAFSPGMSEGIPGEEDLEDIPE